MLSGRERLMNALVKRHGQEKGKRIFEKMTAHWKHKK